MSLSTQKSEMSCPKCKRNLGLSLGDIKPGLIKCPHCRASIRLKGDNVSKEVQEFDNLLKSLPKEIIIKL